MSSTCPSCGHPDFDPHRQCTCGYVADETFFSGTSEKNTKNQERGRMTITSKPNKDLHEPEITVKEIDSWVFKFSPADNSISLGTPALQSFRLRLTLDDLEEILEFIYRRTGSGKTTRQLSLTPEQLPDLIDIVRSMIDEKRAKTPVRLEDGELQKIADVINEKMAE